MTRRSFVTSLLVSAALAASLPATTAVARQNKKRRNKRDHDSVWNASKSGAILPLSEVLGLIGPKINGEIIETEFEYDQGRPVYEFKYVDKKGRVRELYVDARTGIILKDKPD